MKSTFVLATDFNVSNHSLKEIPCYCDVIGALGAGAEDEIADLLIFHHLYRRDCTNVFEFRVADSTIFGSHILDSSILTNFKSRPVFLPQIKPVSLEINHGMNLFDDRR